jgi:hypothetical protein
MKEAKVASALEKATTAAEPMQERIDKLHDDIVGAFRSEMSHRAG